LQTLSFEGLRPAEASCRDRKKKRRDEFIRRATICFSSAIESATNAIAPHSPRKAAVQVFS
jgi:hypothetical protein